MHDGLIYNNEAHGLSFAQGGSGGGVFINDWTRFTMYGGDIAENRALIGRGGGAWFESNGVGRINGGYIRNNIAELGGGGFGMSEHNPAYNARAYINGAMISGNITNGDGGGIWIGPGTATVGARLTMTSGTITGNRAEGDGGAIFTVDHFNYPNPVLLGHYRNLVQLDGEISGNFAGGGRFEAPDNASTWARFDGNLFNNFNINYRGTEMLPNITFGVTYEFTNAPEGAPEVPQARMIDEWTLNVMPTYVMQTSFTGYYNGVYGTWTFSGWSTESNGASADEAFVMPQNDVTFVGYWAFEAYDDGYENGYYNCEYDNDYDNGEYDNGYNNGNDDAYDENGYDDVKIDDTDNEKGYTGEVADDMTDGISNRINDNAYNENGYEGVTSENDDSVNDITVENDIVASGDSVVENSIIASDDSAYADGGNLVLTDPVAPQVDSGNVLVQSGDIFIEIGDDGVPLGYWAWNEEEELWIFEDTAVPLGEMADMSGKAGLVTIPQTGVAGNSILWLLVAISFMAVVAFAVKKKREEEEDAQSFGTYI